VYLKTLRLQNYQAYKDSGEVQLQPGFNLIIGTNNSGKSSFLQALAYHLQDLRHRPQNWPRGQDLPQPSLEISMETSGELLLRIVGFANVQMQYPFPPNYNIDPVATIEEIRSRKNVDVKFRRIVNGTAQIVRQPSHGEFSVSQGSWTSLIVSGQYGNVSYGGVQNGQNDNLIEIFNSWWQRNTFIFKAERFAFSKSPSANTINLEPNASNLPAVLNSLFGEYKSQFDEIVGFVKSIFDTVGDITLRTDPTDNTKTEIVVWPTATGKIGDSGFSLGDCGTGVAQVVALLTGVSTIEKGVFVIDELNAFLHPAAVKALIRILSTHYARHQYIISSHSPDVLAWHGFASVHAVRREGYESHLEPIDLKDMSRVRDLAAELGISPADFFSAENVIWVEGPTEESVFSFIVEATRGALPAATKFVSVISTGDFNRKRDKELVWEVYNRLSSANSPLLHSVRFSFDSEALSETDKADLIRRSDGRTSFIPRRNIEAYFIAPQAIAALLAELDVEVPGKSSEQVMASIATAAEAADSSACWNGDVRNPAWLNEVDGARLLHEIFGQLTDHRVEYDKTLHGLALVKRIFESGDQGLLDDLPEHVLSLLPTAG